MTPSPSEPTCSCTPDVAWLDQLQQWLDILGGPIQWVLIVVGWALVMRLQRKRLARSEFATQLASANDLIDELTQAALEYWRLPANHQRVLALETTIKAKNARLGASVTIIARRAGKLKGDVPLNKFPQVCHDALSACADLSRACTSAPFEQPNRPPATGTARETNILAGAVALQRKLEAAGELA